MTSFKPIRLHPELHGLVALATLAVCTTATPRAMAQCGLWTLRTPAASPAARAFPAMVYDSGRSRTVLFGGLSQSAQLGDTWEWDGNQWTQKSTATAPSARSIHGMAYDSTRGVTVLFGGFAGSGMFPQDTWEWNGTTWTQRNPAHIPNAAINFSMAFDAARNETVLFGGAIVGAGLTDETWVWNGTDWTQKNPAHAPSKRAENGLAYDSGRHVVVLFGGLTDAGPNSDETWEWDGTDWTQRFPATAPSHRYDFSLAYDSHRHVTVLFGGFTDDNFGVNVGETWEWDGADWSKRSPGLEPSDRSEYGMAFDSARGVTVLFGGDSITGRSAETWEWSSPLPAISQQPGPQTVGVGESATFSVNATGVGPFTFQWRRNSSSLSDGGAISGSTTPTLSINPIAATDGADYSCLISNACGSMLSGSASLTVDVCKATGSDGDCDGNGVLDLCEIAANPSLDADHNGALDSCEAAPAEAQITAAPSAPCGLCGGGAASLMPLALGLLSTSRRRRRRTHDIAKGNRS